MVMWKWCTCVFQITWLWNFIITTIYWAMLYPFETHSYGPYETIWRNRDHVLPILLITIDWSINRMHFDWTFVWLNLILALIYGAINIAVTKISGDPIYPPIIAWDTPLHWVIGFLILPWFALYFFI